VTIVPSNSLEIVESAAAQQAVREGRIESLSSPDAPLDALVQHLVTIALGGGFRPDDLKPEILDTVAFEHLADADWRWALDFVAHGGPTLAAYPDFRRVEPDRDGVWRVPNARLALLHRLNIGTRRRRARGSAWSRKALSRGFASATNSGSPANCWRWRASATPSLTSGPPAAAEPPCRAGAAAACRSRRRWPTPWSN
jgi:hypothetical protein